VAAARAIAELIPPEALRPDYVIPSPFDERVAPAVARAVARAALETGVARRRKDPEAIYRDTFDRSVASGRRGTRGGTSARVRRRPCRRTGAPGPALRRAAREEAIPEARARTKAGRPPEEKAPVSRRPNGGSGRIVRPAVGGRRRPGRRPSGGFRRGGGRSPVKQWREIFR
ncbi:hypothetical protein AB1398_01530, partial [Hydrogenibacillus schlegelii]